MKPACKPLLFGLVLALGLVALFRTAGHLVLVEGRLAANLQALAGAGAGFGLGWLVARFCCGLRGVALAALPGLLLMAAIVSHFGLVFPGLDPRFDKGFGGLMLWGYGFMLLGGLLADRGAACRLGPEPVR